MEDVVQLFDKVDQNREAMVDTWKLLVDSCLLYTSRCV